MWLVVNVVEVIMVTVVAVMVVMVVCDVDCGMWIAVVAAAAANLPLKRRVNACRLMWRW